MFIDRDMDIGYFEITHICDSEESRRRLENSDSSEDV